MGWFFSAIREPNVTSVHHRVKLWKTIASFRPQMAYYWIGNIPRPYGNLRMGISSCGSCHNNRGFELKKSAHHL